MEATLSVVRSPSGPYADREVAGWLFHYSYREGSINGDNAKLRRAYELGKPIILLREVRDGVYVPYAPVYVVADLVPQREFLLALDESVRFLGNSDPDAPERRYAERVVRQRLHQRSSGGESSPPIGRSAPFASSGTVSFSMPRTSSPIGTTRGYPLSPMACHCARSTTLHSI